ncbi:outer membrane protein [Novipirellula sp.]|uniref:outer membrane protein n=1 Tax=Novipirellula sp. TaxID=2795430 RepID=UPI003561EC77
MRLGQQLFLVLVVSITGMSSASAQLFNFDNCYVAGSFSGDFLTVEGSGRNTNGNFDASGKEHETNDAYAFAIGREFDYCDYQIRLESQYMFLNDSEFTLNSFPGPPGPYTFFYRGAFTDRFTSMSNLWIDKPISENVEIYAGGGIGWSHFEFAASDGVVVSGKDDVDVAHQFGVGLTCKLLSNVEMDFGYRRMDLGTANTNLKTISGGAPSGNLNVDLDSDQLVLTLRVFRR